MSVDLRPYTTLSTTAKADKLINLTTTEQLLTLSEKLGKHQWLVLGSGSNVLFADDFNGIVIRNQLKGIHIIHEDDTKVTVKVAAGEIWHDTVLSLSQQGFYGLENLALIPGTVGAAPVQNIGAYGVEVANSITSVTVFDIVKKTLSEFSADDCQFAYRDSIFKHEPHRHRYIITAVTLVLSKQFSPKLSYQGLTENGTPQTADELIQQVIRVRQSKLPNPDELPNAGSFFKNPIVDKKVLAQLQQQFEEVPYFDINTEQVKIPAAWLIEMAGFKGHQRSNGAGVYDKHALILVNRGHAHGREIYALACDIMQAVHTQFAIRITPEVRIITT